MSDEDLAALKAAYLALERPKLAAQLANLASVPVERLLALLPDRLHRAVDQAAEAAIGRALEIALWSLDGERPGLVGRRYRQLAMATGAVGGLLGLPALTVELPATTVLMLRAIAEIARNEGEDLSELDARLACLEVFALGGRSRADDNAEVGYYEVRVALALEFSTTLSGLSGHGSALAVHGAARFVRAIASRFGIVVSDKTAATLAPVVGAAAGALVNHTFMAHFQKVAEGHFTIRRLERLYGRVAVREAYEELRKTERSGRPALAFAS